MRSFLPKGLQKPLAGKLTGAASIARRAEEKGAPAPSALAQWKILFDRDKTSIQDFLQHWDIKTDLPDEDGSTDVRYERFTLFEWQEQMLADCQAAWDDGHAYRVRVPKARRRGVSALVRAFLGFERVLRVPGWEYTLIAQDKEAAEEHLGYLEEFFAQAVDQAPLEQLGIKYLKRTADQFIFRHGKYKKSKVTVKTARKSGLGRGGQNNAVHMTERPHWPEKAKKDLSGFLRACANIPGNVIVDESTAMGLDEFYTACMNAQAGIGSYELFFIPSYVGENNYQPFRSKGVRETFTRSLGEDARFGSKTEEATVRQRVIEYRLTLGEDTVQANKKALEYLNWRRTTITDDCGHVKVFHREEPTILEEAFQGWGRLVYPAEIMESWIEPARLQEDRGTHGTLIVRAGKVVFTPHREGNFFVIEPPQPGRTYCFGGDTASGVEVHASGGEEADFTTQTIIDFFTGVTVARFRAHIMEHPAADMYLTAAAYYSIEHTCQGYIERNQPTVVAVLAQDDGEIAGLVGTDILLTSERKVRTDGAWEMIPQFGWNTSSKTKKFMVSTLYKFLVTYGAFDPEKPKPCPVDFLTLQELLRYVNNGKGGTEAEIGHDDLHDSLALAHVAREELLQNGDVPLMSRVPAREEDPFVAHFKRQAARENGASLRTPLTMYHPRGGAPIEVAREKAKGVPGLPGF